MIHRGVISTMERMISYLIELYAGAFPVWLAPVQAIVLPITERQNDYAQKVYEKLIAAGLRAELDKRSEKVNENSQSPAAKNSLHAGDRRQRSRSRNSFGSPPHKGDQGPRPLDQFLTDLKEGSRDPRNHLRRDSSKSLSFVREKGLLRVGLECVLYFLPCLSR